ncbi:hypothetical protein [Bulleidia sp. zg-1006]|uniref:hypothetical protein n=1 Tax=Bulleidia sp. zg-1006 TaxID=2806552 RepID=UPI001939B213|nr:hypothetical protein [Bulleidia sp. zg-1006]QRG86364.1 hypothetical protein JOS54_05785 [Bulleidia sp. zg-1006]
MQGVENWTVVGLLGFVALLYTVYRAVKEVSKDFKAPLSEANSKIENHELRLKNLESGAKNLNEEIESQKEMIRLILVQISALAKDDKEAIKKASENIDKYLRKQF